MSGFSTSGVARTEDAPGLGRDAQSPHLIYLAVGFPPAAKSCAYRMRETANQFAAQGWDVTVVTIADEAWELDSGVDHTLSEQVDPWVNVVRLPLRREDLETDIRNFSEERAASPTQWTKDLRERNLESFPEPTFGSWRGALEDAVLRIHRERPADLLLASCVPYVNLAAAWKLWEEARVPYAVDFRDGWSIDVIDGDIAFGRDSEEGRWEERILGSAVSLWVVNDPIAVARSQFVNVVQAPVASMRPTRTSMAPPAMEMARPCRLRKSRAPARRCIPTAKSTKGAPSPAQ